MEPKRLGAAFFSAAGRVLHTPDLHPIHLSDTGCTVFFLIN
jgi:hypothetical protein